MARLNEALEVDSSLASNFELIPAGWYDATIAKADLTATKSGSGQLIKVTYTISGPTHAGRVVFSNINIKNHNPEAERIGRQQLNNLALAVGLSRVVDTEDLLGGALQIKISEVPAKDGYDAKNEVKGFKAMSASSMPSSVVSNASPKLVNGGSKAPWAK